MQNDKRNYTEVPGRSSADKFIVHSFLYFVNTKNGRKHSAAARSLLFKHLYYIKHITAAVIVCIRAFKLFGRKAVSSIAA